MPKLHELENTIGITVEQPHSVDDQLTQAAREYLRTLREQLDPTKGYVVLLPNGYEIGFSGFSNEYPALSMECALKILEEKLCLARIETIEECRRFKIVDPHDRNPQAKTLYLLLENGSIEKIA